ncbi:MAG: FKBP-type peptidyl-prolyl cis-trans isomerase [Saprospiraceae bacterium]|nr:FKBP-type peptidyl-prolyl cis-trans isomerase [Saprospiraceae bacterium]MCB9325961.1 FKBP-type peptidyl-prolyl cis-trans isomerase [Lewinellaceae bacterium]
MIIEKNVVVNLNYKLQENNAEGSVIEDTGDSPLVFLFGVEQMLPSFEENLEGKKAGDSFAFGLESHDAYGAYEPEYVIPVPKDSFTVNGIIQEDLLVVGNTIPLQDQSGNQMMGTVVEVKEEEVVLDFNHPLAGVNLYFTVQIESIRQATEEELEHGHVHGVGGHPHDGRSMSL